MENTVINAINEDRILLVVVNYNSSIHSENLCNSIKSLHFLIDLIIVDNNSDYNDRCKLVELESNFNFVHIIYLKENCGYFPALNIGLQRSKQRDILYKYIIIGNNDLLFDNCFFRKLIFTNYNKDVFVVAPDIINKNNNHQNPAVSKKYSWIQLKYLDLYFSCYLVASCINLLSKIFKFKGSQKNRDGWNKSSYIAVGYGACYVLTRQYNEIIGEIPNYLFLMNEENSLSDIVFKNGGRIFYDSNLHVIHNEHSSVGQIPSVRMYRIARESYYISKRHFDDSKLYDKEFNKK